MADGWVGACWLRKGGGERDPAPLGTGGRHPWLCNTGETVGGGRESSGSKPFFTPRLPVYIQSRRRRIGM